MKKFLSLTTYIILATMISGCSSLPFLDGEDDIENSVDFQLNNTEDYFDEEDFETPNDTETQESASTYDNGLDDLLGTPSEDYESPTTQNDDQEFEQQQNMLTQQENGSNQAVGMQETNDNETIGNNTESTGDVDSEMMSLLNDMVGDTTTDTVQEGENQQDNEQESTNIETPVQNTQVETEIVNRPPNTGLFPRS